MSKFEWIWMPHPGHLIVSRDCRFHLNTYIGDYIVSTVGEYWPDRKVREIHAEIHDPVWFAENGQKKGDMFDAIYYRRFGYEEIGAGRKYETMVFKAKKQDEEDAQCCPFTASDWSEIDADGYNDSVAAFKGHLAMCEKWAKEGNE